METGAWTLRGRRVVTPSGSRPADVAIREGRVVGVAPHEAPETEGVVLDVGDRVVLPGLVDLRPDFGGGAGPIAPGVTTRFDPGGDFGVVAFDDRAFLAGVAALAGRARVDCGFLGVLGPENAHRLEPLLDAGVFGIKARLGPSEGRGFPVVVENHLRAAMATLARAGRPLVARVDRVVRAPGFLGGHYLAADASAVTGAVRLLIGLCRELGCRVHLAGLAAAEALPLIARARDEGLPFTVGVAAGDLVPGDAPPADLEGRERLWEGLRSGVIEAISSDEGPGGTAHWLGAWSEARRRGFTPDDLARWLSLRPAELIGLAGRKGAITPGCDADLAVFAAGAARVDATFLRGVDVSRAGRSPGPFRGEVLFRTEETVPIGGGLDRLNGLAEPAAIEAFRACCGSTRWAWRMAALRPFATEAALLEAADRVWASLGRADRLEAYAARSRPADPEAPAATRAALAEGYRAYEAKFGHAFAVEPAAPIDDDALDALWRRLAHPPDVEHRFAADEQARITRQALRRLLS